jgi:hypothetical protein
MLQVYRKERQMDAAAKGNAMNSTSKIDAVARILFPLSFGFFNITYWFSYFQAQKPFDWGDHLLKGILYKCFHFVSNQFDYLIFHKSNKLKL